MKLAFDTAGFPEQHGGMMICGIDWGGDPEKTMRDQDRDKYCRSFFSDDSSQWIMNRCIYRKRIVEWLGELGLKLESDPKKAGPLEKSISQINWLPDQSVNTAHQNNLARCTAEHDFFIQHLQHVRPSMVLFLSCDLLRALNTQPCLHKTEHILGKATSPVFESRELQVGERRHPRLKVGTQRFEKAFAVSLPHPAYWGGVADEYIAAFRDVVGPAMLQYLGRFRRQWSEPPDRQ